MPPLEPKPEPPTPSKGFAAVPSRVRWLIFLSAPSNVGGGFFFIAISAYFPEVGLSLDFVGLILGVEGVAMILSAIPLGLASDRRGRKSQLVIGSAVFPPLLLLVAFVRDPIILLLAGILSGVGEAAFLSTWNALIADGTPKEARSTAFSLSFIVGTTTSGIGFATPFVIPYLGAWTGMTSVTLHQVFFVAYGLFGVVTPVALWFLLRDLKETPRPGLAWRRGANFGLLMRFSAINGLIGLGAGFIIPLIPTWLLAKFGMGDAFSGPLIAVSNLLMGLGGFASPRLARKYGSVRAIVLTQGISTAFMLSLAFVPDPWTAGGLYIVRAALMNMASPIMDSYLMGIVSAEERGFASSLNSIIWRLPNSASTVAGGFILGAGLFDLPFFLATTLYAIGVTTFFLVFRNVKAST